MRRQIASNAVRVDAVKVEQLAHLAPGLDRGCLRDVLRTFNNDLGRAADALADSFIPTTAGEPETEVSDRWEQEGSKDADQSKTEAEKGWGTLDPLSARNAGDTRATKAEREASQDPASAFLMRLGIRTGPGIDSKQPRTIDVFDDPEDPVFMATGVSSTCHSPNSSLAGSAASTPSEAEANGLVRTMSALGADSASFIRKAIAADAARGEASALFLHDMPAYTFLLPSLISLPEDLQIQLYDQFLDYDTQTQLEKTEVLNWHPSCTRLVSLRTEPDGNCLLHAASIGMWGVHDRSLVLRATINRALLKGPPQDSDADQLESQRGMRGDSDGKSPAVASRLELSTERRPETIRRMLSDEGAGRPRGPLNYGKRSQSVDDKDDDDDGGPDPRDFEEGGCARQRQGPSPNHGIGSMPTQALCVALRRRWRESFRTSTLAQMLERTDSAEGREWSSLRRQASLTPEAFQSGMRPRYRFLESFHILVLAHVLRRPVIVSASDVRDASGSIVAAASEMAGIYLPLEWPQNLCRKSPLVLGFSGSHFTPLVAMHDSGRRLLSVGSLGPKSVGFSDLEDAEALAVLNGGKDSRKWRGSKGALGTKDGSKQAEDDDLIDDSVEPVIAVENINDDMFDCAPSITKGGVRSETGQASGTKKVLQALGPLSPLQTMQKSSGPDDGQEGPGGTSAEGEEGGDPRMGNGYKGPQAAGQQGSKGRGLVPDSFSRWLRSAATAAQAAGTSLKESAASAVANIPGVGSGAKEEGEGPSEPLVALIPLVLPTGERLRIQFCPAAEDPKQYDALCRSWLRTRQLDDDTLVAEQRVVQRSDFVDEVLSSFSETSPGIGGDNGEGE